ncbi:hypothetical protein ABZU25_21450 [Micromonospora sp. NPDC005215]|uniref:hypothetical protein n=1 Tax=Micromonospora sp. NPDC005215 TaxID=3157024 RepID=UPI0033A775BA
MSDVANGRAELVVVPSAAALGNGRQAFERIGAVRRARGDTPGPAWASTRTARSSRA